PAEEFFAEGPIPGSPKNAWETGPEQPGDSLMGTMFQRNMEAESENGVSAPVLDSQDASRERSLHQVSQVAPSLSSTPVPASGSLSARRRGAVLKKKTSVNDMFLDRTGSTEGAPSNYTGQETARSAISLAETAQTKSKAAVIG
ncbi:unnamed protein product, partial [Amoebophrya sp. A25]